MTPSRSRKRRSSTRKSSTGKSARTSSRKKSSPRKTTPKKSSRKPSARTRRNRKIGAGIAVAVVLALGGFAATQDGLLDQFLDQVEAAPGGSGNGGSGSTSGDVDADRAREQLAQLDVEQWRSMSGYSRDRFSHWRTIDGCDARQTVLARDGEDIVTEDDSCRVVSGTWHSAFDDEILTDPSDIDIDHLVPLAAGWRSGADEWDDDRRADFANDLDTPQLIAVSASSNRAKGDQDPSQWMPVRGYRCQYAHDWIVVKHAWDLSVTAEEHDALIDMLDTC